MVIQPHTPPFFALGYVDRWYKGSSPLCSERHWFTMAGPPLLRTLLCLGLSSVSRSSPAISTSFPANTFYLERLPSSTRSGLMVAYSAGLPGVPSNPFPFPSAHLLPPPCLGTGPLSDATRKPDGHMRDRALTNLSAIIQVASERSPAPHTRTPRA
jgi:hypothetical protein